MSFRYCLAFLFVFAVVGSDWATGKNYQVFLTVNQGKEVGAKVSALTSGSTFTLEAPVVTEDAIGDAAFTSELTEQEGGKLLLAYRLKLKLPVDQKLPELSGSGNLLVAPDKTYEFLSFGETRCSIRVAPCSGEDSPDSIVLLTGFDSDNVVALNLDSGKVMELIQLEDEARPRGVAQSSTGDIFVSLRGSGRNVLKFSMTDGKISAQPITGTIGRYGPAQLLMSVDDELFAACDSTHQIRRFSGGGELLETYQGSIGGNVCGIAIYDKHLFSAHLFEGSISKTPLSGAGEMERIFKDRDVIDRPYALTVTRDGDLLVSAYEGDGRVRKIDRESGEYLGDFLDLDSSNISGVSAMLYHAQRDSYLIGKDYSVIEFGSDGKEIQRYVMEEIERVMAISEARNVDALDSYRNFSYAEPDTTSGE